MRTLILLAGLALVPKVSLPTPSPATFSASDGVQISAVTYGGRSPAAPAILLFHQADSGKSEYDPIAPRLALLGYNVLAIDQRSGGDMYGPNETVRRLGRSAPYASALLDMEAALAYAKRRFPGARIDLLGSSYSAGLVFALAANHPQDVAAVLAFSPGEYFDDKRFVRSAARRVKVPVFIDSAADAEEEKRARSIFDVVGSTLKVDYVPKAGIHGASTLRNDRDPAGAAENWDAMTAFLAKLPGGE